MSLYIASQSSLQNARMHRRNWTATMSNYNVHVAKLNTLI